MSAPWKVGRWARGEYVNLPWYACDRGGWFGKGLPGKSFPTQRDAFDYAFVMSSLMSVEDWISDWWPL